ncbi:MAG: hypothetical protein KDG52_03550 [Rhodocyclaceae bacterium]|nr:hypothetical protein [Rhodocyclaceae bacterium]
MAGLDFEVASGGLPAASALAKRRYQQRGLGTVGVGGTGDRVPGITVLAKHGAHLWATLRLGLDSIAGLQADTHYRQEIDRLRGSSRHIAEVTRLAIDAPCPPGAMLMEMFRQAVRQLRHQAPITDLVIEVNPRHARFYVQRFGFIQIGDERICSRVGAPAVLLHRPISSADLATWLAD